MTMRSGMNMTKMTVSIVTHNNEGSIAKTLQSLSESRTGDVRVLIRVIDNGSTDRTKAEIEPFASRVEMISSPDGNIGFGAAHNLSMSQLDSDIHVIMNPDVTLVSDDFFERIADYLSGHEAVGMVVPRIENEQGDLQYLCRRELTVLDLLLRFAPIKVMKKRRDWHEMRDMDYSRSFEVPFASGCCMAIRTSLFKEIGGFDERFFLYVEDADLTKRVNGKMRTIYLPDVIVCHRWERASYHNGRMTRLHLKSLWRYFRKWGFRFK
ncbi:MAG: glycosyltransferase family 2 protein [Clostridiales bacterium]|nr:glycosyltransferase family 2 protein [Clostridiales bacterium]